MQMKDVIDCICKLITAIYPIIKDIREAQKEKKPASDGSDRKRTKLL